MAARSARSRRDTAVGDGTTRVQGEPEEVIHLGRHGRTQRRLRRVEVAHLIEEVDIDGVPRRGPQASEERGGSLEHPSIAVGSGEHAVQKPVICELAQQVAELSTRLVAGERPQAIGDGAAKGLRIRIAGASHRPAASARNLSRSRLPAR
jgi:hypothetical protein